MKHYTKHYTTDYFFIRTAMFSDNKDNAEKLIKDTPNWLEVMMEVLQDIYDNIKNNRQIYNEDKKENINYWIEKIYGEKLTQKQKEFLVKLSLILDKEITEKDVQQYFHNWANEWLQDLKEESIISKIDKKQLENISKEELVVAIYYLVLQNMVDSKNEGDTMALSDNCPAVALLYKLGLVEIENAYYRRAIFKLKEIWGEKWKTILLKFFVRDAINQN